MVDGDYRGITDDKTLKDACAVQGLNCRVERVELVMGSSGAENRGARNKNIG